MPFVQLPAEQLPQRVIIFDGPDMCGKSNIARELSQRIGVPYFKASSEHETFLHRQSRFIDQLEHADPRVLDFLKQTGHSVIFDRAYPSEWVYSKLLDRPTNMPVLHELDRGYAAIGAKLIVCVRSSYAGITDDIQPKFTQEVLEKQDALYRQFAGGWTLLDNLVLDTSSEDLPAQITTIREFLGY